MSMRTIFSLRKGRDEPTEPYYRWFKSSIFTDELEKFTSTTYKGLHRTFTGGDNNDGARKFQEICLLI